MQLNNFKNSSGDKLPPEECKETSSKINKIVINANNTKALNFQHQ